MEKVICILDFKDFIKNGNWYLAEYRSNPDIWVFDRWTFKPDDFKKHFMTLKEYREGQLEELGI